MKHLFYCLFLMLLCVGCSKEDDPLPEERTDSSSAMTRMGGNIDLTLSGSTVLISWTRPFGYNVGISVEVFIAANGIETVVGKYSSAEDSGRGSFSVSSGIPNLNYIPNTVSLKARVRDLPRYGPSRESVTVSVHNTNSPDPNNPGTTVCNHSLIYGNPTLGIVVDPFLERINFYRGVNHAGLLVFKFGVGYLERYDPITGQALFRSEETIQSAGFGPAPSPDGTATNLLTFGLPAMSGFANISTATASLEVRMYDISCQKLGHSGNFPECTHYFKYEFSNVPLASINRSVTMNAVKETRPLSGSY